MRILYIGNFGPDWSTETHVAASLRALGHEVIAAQECTTRRAFAEDIGRPGPEVKGWTVEEIAAESARCDFLLWTRTWGARERGWSVLRDVKIPTVAYHLDLYAGLPRSADVDAEPWWKCDLVCTADGGSDAFWTAHKVNHRWVRAGVYHAEAVDGTFRPELACDVAFVGSGGPPNYHPEWPYRRKLIEWLRHSYGPHFRHFGGAGGLKDTWRGKRLNDIYASAKVVVGDSLCLGFNHPRYWSDRVYETTGRGGCMVHPMITGLEDSFDDGASGAPDEISFYTFDALDDLRIHIDFLLADPEAREAQRRAGAARTRRDHTYMNRMSEIVGLVEAGV